LLSFLKYPAYFWGGGGEDQKLGCAAYLHANIDDIAVFHYMMICLLS
jgi:hypothetical protein